MSFPRYPKYKASGVEWLGDVPEHWVVCGPKRRIKSSAGGTLIKGTCADEPSDGLFPGFSASGQNIWLQEYAYDCQAIVLSAVGARCGKAFKADGKWGVVANTHCLFPRADSNRDYLWFLTNQEDWWEKGGSAQPFVKVSETLARPWVFPPLPEQTAIAEFLDRETGKIDELVAEQRRLMELLKEKRQVVISHAVTKGLNPHAPRKPSGIEWLGDVPEGWAVVSLSTVAKMIQTGPFGSQLHSDEYVENGTPVINPSNIQEGRIEPDWSCSITAENANRLSQHKLMAGDIVFGRRGEMGRCALVTANEAGWICGTGSLNVRLMPRAFPPFISIYLRTEYVREWLKLESVGSTMDNLNTQILGAIKLPLPSLGEQTSIVEFLETELTKFDTLTAEAQRAIDLLQERRTALISAAVTGQIDVRNHSPKN